MNLTGIRFPQRIYQSDQEAQIDMNEYICENAKLFKRYQSPSDIEFTLTIEGLVLDVSQAIPWV